MFQTVSATYSCSSALLIMKVFLGICITTNFAYGGEIIIFPGTAPTPDPLRPGFVALFPSSPTSNTLQVNSTFSGRVYGALVQGNGNASFSNVDISANVTGNIHGGYVRGNGQAFGNTVRIGSSTTVDVFNEDAEFQGVTGGHTFGNFQAFDNTVDISGQVIGPVGGGGVVAGGYSRGNGKVSDNMVIVRPGAIVGSSGSRVSIYGGYNLSDSSSPSDAIDGNTVIIYGGSVNGDIYGGLSDASGPGISSEADNNHVFIYGGTVNGDIYGGHSDNSSSDNNSIYLGGGAISGRVIGGHLDFGGGTAQNNRITIVGNSDLNLENAFLYGNTPGGQSWRTDNNTLVVDRFRQSVNGNVFDVANFQNYEFITSESTMNGDVLLNITNPGPLTNIDSSTITVDVLGGEQPIQSGGSLYLFKTNGNNLLTGIPAGVAITQGVSLVANAQIEQTSDYLRIVVGGVSVNPNVIDEVDGHLASIDIVRQIASLTAVQGIRSALDSSCDTSCDTSNWAPFVTISGGTERLRVSDSSRMTVDSANLLGGFARKEQWTGASLLLGWVFEVGTGSYRTPANGRGDLGYYGAGLLSRLDLDSGFYTEGTAQMGRLGSDYRSSVHMLADPYGQPAEFDSTSTYMGAHAGVGYKRRLTEKFNLDIAVRYIWSWLGSDSLEVASDPQHFDAVNSHVLQGGGRIDYAVTEQFTSYIGAAYEYEFDGNVRGVVYGYSLPSRSLKGGTGMGEIGFTYTPAGICGFSADVGLQGYVGEREGVSGSLRLLYEF